RPGRAGGVRARRSCHADSADAICRSDHEAVSTGDQSAPERVAAQRVLRLGAGEHRLYRPRPVDARHRGQPHGGGVAAAPLRRESVMERQSERGIALVLALFLMTALSVLGASLMFLSQTETYAGMNYRMMSQARYAAEAGVNKGANFLLDGVQYAVPTVNPGVDPLINYDINKSPVEFGGKPVILTAG